VNVEDEPRLCQLEDDGEFAMLDKKLDAWMLEDESDV
jgi:hypothetical protein